MLAASSVGAMAQTTVSLSHADSQVWNATIRGGSYTSKNLPNTLETRAADDAEYRRRALLKFDTQNTLPKGSSVTSAVLTVTVKEGSEDSTRRVGAYQVTTSWDLNQVTWNNRRSGQKWGTAGGDLGTQLDDAVVGNKAGTRVSFDVTSLVKSAVAGSLGSSRYTRIALVDLEGSTSGSWRTYYTAADSTASRRPTLTITYGKAAPTPTTTPSAPTDGKVLKVLHWNIQKNGWGTDGKYSPSRIVSWVAKLNPDIISFNELEKWNQYSQGEDGVALYESLLEAKTGVKWYTWDVQDYGVWSDKGLRSVVFSKYPFSSTYRTSYSAGKLKAVGGATINVNGRTINFMTTHFDPYSAGERAQQAKDLVSYMSGHAESRIVCGDFNDQASNPPITTMTKAYKDAWAEGKKAGIAHSAPDNSAGNTRSSRIDYMFYSRGTSHLTLRKITVVDTRDSNDVMPSDHRPVFAEFVVN